MMQSSNYEFFEAVFHGKIGPNDMLRVFWAVNGEEDSLLKRAATVYFDHALVGRKPAVVGYLKDKRLASVAHEIVLNNARSALFFFKYCLLPDEVTIFVNDGNLTMVVPDRPHPTAFMCIDYAHTASHALKAIRRFLKICTTRRMRRIIVSLPEFMERDMNLTEVMKAHASQFDSTTDNTHWNCTFWGQSLFARSARASLVPIINRYSDDLIRYLSDKPFEHFTTEGRLRNNTNVMKFLFENTTSTGFEGSLVKVTVYRFHSDVSFNLRLFLRLNHLDNEYSTTVGRSFFDKAFEKQYCQIYFGFKGESIEHPRIVHSMDEFLRVASPRIELLDEYDFVHVTYPNRTEVKYIKHFPIVS
ncbi:unnamed protein product [Caenorhabditis sp. 36 PRJEB53466]|nr:unnamed protein product [Caenorhabditis sp. 36 PRJEB53466]